MDSTSQLVLRFRSENSVNKLVYIWSISRAPEDYYGQKVFNDNQITHLRELQCVTY